MKTRLDRLLVERRLAESREKAQALIMAGEVLVDGQKAAKPGQSVAEDAALEVLAHPPYVSRGGFKLAAALRQFEIDVTGEVCIDIGSSTGGFTDSLLQAGAARVHAVDVRRADNSIGNCATDPLVVVHEGHQCARFAHSPILANSRRLITVRCQLHFGHADPTGGCSAFTERRPNGDTDQTTVRSG